jgi:hypothetical protein
VQGALHALEEVAQSDDLEAKRSIISSVLATLRNLLCADIQLVRSEAGVRLSEGVSVGLACVLPELNPDGFVPERSAPAIALWIKHARDPAIFQHSSVELKVSPRRRTT